MSAGKIEIGDGGGGGGCGCGGSKDKYGPLGRGKIDRGGGG